jgi:hypothetical protein
VATYALYTSEVTANVTRLSIAIYNSGKQALEAFEKIGQFFSIVSQKTVSEQDKAAASKLLAAAMVVLGLAAIKLIFKKVTSRKVGANSGAGGGDGQQGGKFATRTPSQTPAPGPKPVAPPATKPGAAGSPEHKAQRWTDYQARMKDNPKAWSKERWEKQYDTNMKNNKFGLSREADYRAQLGGVSSTQKTPFTNRQIDIYQPDQDYMGQLKTGKVSLTKQAIEDIKKDAHFVKDGINVEYILEKGASKPFLKALDDAGIKYTIGPKI